MNIHWKTHSEEEKSRCNQCKYAFSEAGDLRRHLKNTNANAFNRHLKHIVEKKNKCPRTRGENLGGNGQSRTHENRGSKAEADKLDNTRIEARDEGIKRPPKAIQTNREQDRWGSMED